MTSNWGQFVTAIIDALIVPNGKVAAGVADIPLQMGQDVADTLVDDGIESLSQHQPLNAEMEAANVLGTLVGDGLVYGGRDIANNYRENTAPLADSSDTDLKLGDPLVQSLASMNLGIGGMDLTWQDIYGPAQQPSPQASNTPRNNGNANPSTNSMTQQTTSAAEQAAAQASANTQAQLQGQRGVQNAQAAQQSQLTLTVGPDGMLMYVPTQSLDQINSLVAQNNAANAQAVIGAGKAIGQDVVGAVQDLFLASSLLSLSVFSNSSFTQSIQGTESRIINDMMAPLAYSNADQAAAGFATNMGLTIAAGLETGTDLAFAVAGLSRVGLFGSLGGGVQSVLDGAEYSVYHTVTSAGGGQGVLDGIDPFRFNDNSRFGAAFYLSEVPDTTISELMYHDSVGVDTIRFDFNSNSANILDLSDPEIAKSWEYSGGDDYEVSQMIAQNAQQLGFDVIRYPSERGVGANLAVFNNFENLLTPQMIVPVPAEYIPEPPGFN